MSDLSNYVIRNCTVAFKCKQKWEKMKEQDIAIIRHCNKCDQDVFQVRTVRQLKNALLMNRCVAIHMDIFDIKPSLIGVVIPKDKQRQ
jgi:hypothetical protein